MDISVLKQKIHRAISSPIIGAVVFSDEEWEHIRKISFDTYVSAMRRPNKTFVASEGMDCVLLMIVNSAKKWTSGRENRFWKSIFDQIFDDPDVSQQKMYDAIEQVLANHGAQGVFTSPSGRLFYSFFLYHAMAPRESLEAFITMLWRDFYLDEELLNANYEADNPLIGQLRKSLCRMFERQEMLEKDIEFGKGKYSVRSGLKQAFLQRSEEEMTGLLHTILSRMDQMYYGNTPSAADNELICMCDEIIGRLIYAERQFESRSVVRTRGHALPDISRVSAAYRLDEEKGPMIVFPKMRVLDTQEDCAILNVYVDTDNTSRMIFSGRRNVLGTELKRMLAPIEIPLEMFRRELARGFHLRVEILVDNRVCYNSRKTLYRDFLLFKNGFERTGALLAPDTYDVYMPVKLRDVLRKNFSGRYGDEKNGCIPVDFREGDSLEAGDIPVLFSEYTAEMKLHLSGDRVSGLVWKGEDGEYRIYRSMPAVSLGPIHSEDIRGAYGVFHNGEYCGPLREAAEFAENDFWKIRTEGFAGFRHHIEIRDVTTHVPLTEKRFCICADAKLIPENCYGSAVRYCYGDRAYVSCIFNGVRSPSPMGPNGEFMPAPALGGSVLCRPPQLKWRIDQLGWNRKNSGALLWHREKPLHNNALLEVDMDFDADVSLWIGETKAARIPGAKRLFRLGDAISAWREQEDEAVLVVDGDRHRLFTVTRRPGMKADPVIALSDGVLSLDAAGCLIGDSDARLCLTLTDCEDEVYHLDDMSIRDKRETDIPDNDYECRIELLINRLTGEKLHLRTIEEITLGNPYVHMFDERALELTKMWMTDAETGRKDKRELSDCVIRDIRYVEMELLPLFRGRLFAPRQKAMDVEFTIFGDSLRLSVPEDADYEAFSLVKLEERGKGKKKREAYAISRAKAEQPGSCLFMKVYCEEAEE